MSLNARIALAASFILAIFIALTTLALDRAFMESAKEAQEEKLQGELLLLISVAEVDEKGDILMPASLSEPRLSRPGSGLYAGIVNEENYMVWSSASASSIKAPFGRALSPGQKKFEDRFDEEGKPYFLKSMGTKWAVGKGHKNFTFSVCEDQKGFNAQISRYRKNLWGWLGLMASLLLIAQAFVLRLGLSPLRKVAQELEEIEAGRKEKLGQYPKELRVLTENLNGLLFRERARQKRYKEALADLAHSLKTPLAVMRSALREENLKNTVEEEVAKMDRIVGYQLQRAATSSASNFSASIILKPLAEKIARSLEKVYAEKGVRMELKIDNSLCFRAEEGDMMEMLGNLLDNACKYGGKQVVLSAQMVAGEMAIAVEDDGPGMPSGADFFQRGVRADEAVAGQGIGLSVVRDIAASYGWDVEVGKSGLGGAKITLHMSSRL